MENSEHSIAHEAAGSSPAEAGCGEDILDLVCTLFWPVSNQKVSEAYQFNNNICFDWVIGHLVNSDSFAVELRFLGKLSFASIILDQICCDMELKVSPDKDLLRVMACLKEVYNSKE